MATFVSGLFLSSILIFPKPAVASGRLEDCFVGGDGYAVKFVGSRAKVYRERTLIASYNENVSSGDPDDTILWTSYGEGTVILRHSQPKRVEYLDADDRKHVIVCDQ
jgi:hypothetical protein